jgi:GH25 family lysozyme M1 (1,4-beta-N-acetylmuramidase)
MAGKITQAVQGVDVSTSQGTVDWAKVKQNGIAFAYIKASEGLNQNSPTRAAYFRSNWKKTRDAGILHGAYHFFRANQDAELQAMAFVQAIEDVGGLQADDLPPMLDVETTDSTAQEMIILRVHRCLDKIGSELNVTPLIYTYKDFWDENLDDSFGDFPFWIASYPDSVNIPTSPKIPTRPRPALPSPFEQFVFWQYGSKGLVSGIKTNVDLDLFEGTLQGLKDFSASMRARETGRDGRNGMTLVRDLDLQACNTRLVRGLSLQIIAEINGIVPGVLVNFEDLDVEIAGAAVNPYVQPAAKEALRNALRERPGQTLSITSAYRTVVQQLLLRRQFEQGLCGITAAALPGRSNHENGLALDVPDFAEWRDALDGHAWQWFGPGDKVHFTYVGGGARSGLGSVGVQAFQQLWNRHNPQDRIAEDGQFGPQTEARLDASPAEGFAVARILRLDDPPMQGDDVLRLQQALQTDGFDIAATGIFDTDTETAVKSFQAQNDLAVDGIVGPMTWEALGVLF